MASWLKAAEDLFEVVDRRAKLVVNDLAEEQKNSPASNGQGSQAKKTKQQKKAVKRPSTTESPREIDAAEEHVNVRTPQIDAKPDGDTSSGSVENEGSHLHKSISLDNEHLTDLSKEKPVEGNATPPEKQANNIINHNLHNDEVAAAEPIAETPASSLSSDLVNENAKDAHDESAASPLPTKVVEVANEDHSVDACKKIEVEVAIAPTKVEQESSQSAVSEVPISNGGEMKHADQIDRSSSKTEDSMHKEQASAKLQEQLDEAHGLLKTATSTGQSKEARLARVCTGLQSRLQEYKLENQQLEELLTSERELSKSYEAHIKQLQQDLSAAKNEATRVESSMAEALTAKNSEIEALLKSVDSLKTQVALSEGNLSSLQVNMESIMRNRELTETRMMQALREELASAERRAEEERAAHNASKKAAREREVELEHRAVEASTALARIQRTIDERTARIAELEQQKALLEVENSSLNQELHDMEARVRREQKKSPEETNKLIQMQAWQEEVASARQGQRDAENKVSAMEAELQKMKVELAAMRRDAEHYSRQEHTELEKRYRELTDLLYYKQTQVEAMASEKAAAEFQLEKELKRTQEAQAEAERNRVLRRASSSWEEDSEMKALEPLPLHHRHMVGASIQLQKAAKLLDSGAARATRFLWRYPTARLLLLFYLVFVHLFLMYLLHHLQEQADKFSASEVAESMGLATPTLP